MRAWLNLRYTVPERRKAFHSGLKALGYKVAHGLPPRPGRDDILVTWNRIGPGHNAAKIFEAHRRPVIVTENASWGNEFAGDRWYTLALNFHNSANRFPIGDSERWDRLGVELAPWRETGETVILPQRGIGPPGVAMPIGWAAQFAQRGRVRKHPGQRKDLPSLEEDLARAARVVTWGSGAAIKALMMGIRVESHMPNWIGAQDNTDSGRLAMFRQLAWAQWRLSEIASGVAFEWLLKRQ